MAAVTFEDAAQLKALKPAGKWYDAKYTGRKPSNLIVRVGPADTNGKYLRTFVYVGRLAGSSKPTKRKIGNYPAISLADAARIASEWRTKLDTDKSFDPRQIERDKLEEAARKRDLRFGVVLESFVKEKLSKQRRGGAVEYELTREVLPYWKDKPITDLTDDDVKAVVERIVRRGKLAHAHNVLTGVRSFFNWAINQSYGMKASPCERIKPKAIIGEKKPRQIVLKDAELLALWRASRRLGYPYGPLFQLLAITGQRKSEVSDARWREFRPELVRMLRDRDRRSEPVDWTKVDPEWKIWTVPPERFKSDASHIVPLSDDALAVLETIPHFRGERIGDHLFSTTSGIKPVNGFSKAKVQLDRLMLRTLKALARKQGDDPANVVLPDFVLHDVRRTVRTRLSSLRIPTEIAEMVIGHGKKGLARIYDQHEFRDEMREALDLWAGRLRSIVSPPPNNVVSLRSARDG